MSRPFDRYQCQARANQRHSETTQNSGEDNMLRDRSMLVLLVAIMQLATPNVSAQSQSAGLKLAEKLCARCHAIGPGEIGRNPLAPTFQDIAKRYSVWDLQEALAEGILVGHATMPAFVLKPKEIGDLLTYMDTFTPPKKKSP
jgi:mono/diheme cytochrome c family protein